MQNLDKGKQKTPNNHNFFSFILFYYLFIVFLHHAKQAVYFMRL